MLYAILAYHVEAEVLSWTPEADAAVMTELHPIHDRLKQAGQLASAARLTVARAVAYGQPAPPRANIPPPSHPGLPHCWHDNGDRFCCLCRDGIYHRYAEKAEK